MKCVTVNDLIEFLKEQDGDLPVIYGMWSESVLLELDSISVEDACEPRPDGWVANKRPDKPTRKYLVLPGN